MNQSTTYISKLLTGGQLIEGCSNNRRNLPRPDTTRYTWQQRACPDCAAVAAWCSPAEINAQRARGQPRWPCTRTAHGPPCSCQTAYIHARSQKHKESAVLSCTNRGKHDEQRKEQEQQTRVLRHSAHTATRLNFNVADGVKLRKKKCVSNPRARMAGSVICPACMSINA